MFVAHKRAHDVREGHWDGAAEDREDAHGQCSRAFNSVRMGAREPIGIEHSAPAADARAFDLGASSCLAGSATHAAHSQHNTHCVVVGAREHERSKGICVLVYALGRHSGMRYSTQVHAAGKPAFTGH